MELAGSLLIAMPGMGDARFEHSVVLVCAHSPQGAMGLVVNKSAPTGMGWPELAEHLGLSGGKAGKVTVQFGGPVEHGRGFVLHSPDWPRGRPAQSVAPGLVLTSTRDILEDIAAGRGPARALLMLGYAGWGPGQLEAEIGANGWLTGKADAELVLGGDNPRKWEAALRMQGIDPLSLSSAAGRA